MELLYNALVVPDGDTAPYPGWVAIGPDGKIAAMGRGEVPAPVADAAAARTDLQGDLLLPGAIDCHVHMREPGLTHKGDLATESRAALAGGVTSYIDMPNCVPQTTDRRAWEDKMQRAAATSAANYAFMLGATASNLPELLAADPRYMPAVKVFMGSSTGGMLLQADDALRAVFAEQPHRVVVHAEHQGIIERNMAATPPGADLTDMMWHSRWRDAEACVRATARALELAARYGTRLHVAHVSTAAETALFDPSPLPVGKQYTAEVSPHHLWHSTDDYARLGSRIKMNPSVKSPADRAALRQALAQGRLDIVATDHAPHLLSEKAGDVRTALSGAPMVQFSLPAMLELYDPATVVRRMCQAPALLYGIEGRGTIAPGQWADLVRVHRLDQPYTVADADVISRCGWTPMAGSTLHHRIIHTWVNGGMAPQPLTFS